MIYTHEQLEQLWVDQGGSRAAADMAAAIAQAESGGDPNAVDYDSNGSVDRGLWQINSVHGSLSTFDVDANARAAIELSSNGTDWEPWVTYQTGAYRQFLQSSPPPVTLGSYPTVADYDSSPIIVSCWHWLGLHGQRAWNNSALLNQLTKTVNYCDLEGWH